MCDPNPVSRASETVAKLTQRMVYVLVGYTVLQMRMPAVGALHHRRRRLSSLHAWCVHLCATNRIHIIFHSLRKSTQCAGSSVDWTESVGRIFCVTGWVSAVVVDPHLRPHPPHSVDGNDLFPVICSICISTRSACHTNMHIHYSTTTTAREWISAFASALAIVVISMFLVGNRE